ncbi:peptidylprolyl isomerase [Alphaproteobacteria bacterium]|jgi:peptidylprolyl isomerase|nr:peptidylprolyl isomerase [Alphaproteobacteria bacterium]
MRKLFAFLTIGIFAFMTSTASAQTPDPENVLVLELKDGLVYIETLPEVAPNHVRRIKQLVGQGFYDGIVFHRVMSGFMAQTGDPNGTGTGGSGRNIRAEFSDHAFDRGVLGMARSQSEDSADSQFFIMFAPGHFLNGKYTVWGRVVQGMEFVDAIKKAPEGSQSGQVENPDKMISLKILADVMKDSKDDTKEYIK